MKCLRGSVLNAHMVGGSKCKHRECWVGVPAPPGLREWSLIKLRGGGGATKREWGASDVLLLQKGGVGNILTILKPEGGTKQFVG